MKAIFTIEQTGIINDESQKIALPVECEVIERDGIQMLSIRPAYASQILLGFSVSNLYHWRIETAGESVSNPEVQSIDVVPEI